MVVKASLYSNPLTLHRNSGTQALLINAPLVVLVSYCRFSTIRRTRLSPHARQTCYRRRAAHHMKEPFLLSCPSYPPSSAFPLFRREQKHTTARCFYEKQEYEIRTLSVFLGVFELSIENVSIQSKSSTNATGDFHIEAPALRRETWRNHLRHFPDRPPH